MMNERQVAVTENRDVMRWADDGGRNPEGEDPSIPGDPAMDDAGDEAAKHRMEGEGGRGQD